LDSLSLFAGLTWSQVRSPWLLARDLYEKRLPVIEPETDAVDSVDLYELSETDRPRGNSRTRRALAALYLVR